MWHIYRGYSDIFVWDDPMMSNITTNLQAKPIFREMHTVLLYPTTNMTH